MNLNRREFIRLMGLAGAAGMFPRLGVGAADASGLYDMPAFGNARILHFTDCHAQLNPIYFREPSVNLGFGSAFGKGGVRARLLHHLGRASKPHWHIDYLRRHFGIDCVYWSAGERDLEHRWASALTHRDDTIIPLRKFGASDCRCESHFFGLEDRLASIEPTLVSKLVNGASLHRSEPATLLQKWRASPI